MKPKKKKRFLRQLNWPVFLMGAAVLCGIGLSQLTAKTPTPSPPTATATVTPPTLQMSANMRASIVAGQIINQVNQTLVGAKQIIDNGVPEQNGQPAISATEVKAALGADNVAKILNAAQDLADKKK